MEMVIQLVIQYGFSHMAVSMSEITALEETIDDHRLHIYQVKE